METAQQLCYPVRTLAGEELLPAGAFLSKSTMAELVRSAEKQRFPFLPLLEYGTIASDLQRICQHPPYCQMFSDPLRRKDVFDTMQQVVFPQPLLDVYGYFRAQDPYTYWHILIVFALSLLLAQELIEDRRELARGVAASPSHDFGKICVPLDVLKKATPLEEHEQQQLSHHAAAGYALLSYYLRDPNHPAAVAARDHHERCDGSGYPRGILLQNRVVEIVSGGDIFDALISQRPYRPKSYDVRTALEAMTLQGQQGVISMEVVHSLIRFLRGDLPCLDEDIFSDEVRGDPPSGNSYRGARQCRFVATCGLEEGGCSEAGGGGPDPNADRADPGA